MQDADGLLDSQPVVSPELVLVDPELAARVREGDGPNGVPRFARPDVEPAAAAPPVDTRTFEHRDTGLPREAKTTATAEPTRRRRGLTRVLALGLPAIAVAAWIAFALSGRERADPVRDVVGVAQAPQPTVASPQRKPGAASPSEADAGRPRVPDADPGSTTAGVGSGSREKPSRAQPERPASSPTQEPTNAPLSLPPLAWVEVPAATGYHVELFRAGRRVFARDTTSARITIPQSWRLGGRAERLVPGRYRWYVWARVSGRLSPEPIVQSTIAVPAG